MKITVADFNIEIKNKYKFIENQCADYINDFDKPDFIIEVTEEEINREKQRQSYQECFKDSYIELVLVYRKLCFMLPENDAIMLHSAVFSLGNRVIALVANSGVGKTTHMMFYKELFGDKVIVINGDKPIIRYIDNELFVYGTPWCGKEKLNTNIKKKLTDICFINRSEKNNTGRMDKGAAVRRLLRQIYLPKTDNAADKTLLMLDKILEKFNVWEINCTKDIEAAKTYYIAIFKEGEGNETEI